MSITLDMSPSLINKTALHTICHDLRQILSSFNPKLFYMGQVFDRLPTAAERETLERVLFDALGRVGDGETGADLRWKLRQHGTPRQVGEIRHFTDPLYTLFSDLQASDLVVVHDVSTVTHPHWHPASVSALYSLAFTNICGVEPRIFADSTNTMRTMYANFGFPQEKMQHVPNYVPAHFSPVEGESIKAVNPYFLFVGSLEVRKNIIGAIRAFAIGGFYKAGYRLIVVGGDGHGSGAAREAARSTPGIVMYGYASNEEIRALYGGATGFVYPSYLEGFGVPLLEALNYGLPSVAACTGACPEVGGPHVAICDPDDHEGIAEEMWNIARLDPQERAAKAVGMRRWVQETYSFDKFAANHRRAVLSGEP